MMYYHVVYALAMGFERNWGTLITDSSTIINGDCSSKLFAAITFSLSTAMERLHNFGIKCEAEGKTMPWNIGETGTQLERSYWSQCSGSTRCFNVQAGRGLYVLEAFLLYGTISFTRCLRFSDGPDKYPFFDKSSYPRDDNDHPYLSTTRTLEFHFISSYAEVSKRKLNTSSSTRLSFICRITS